MIRTYLDGLYHGSVERGLYQIIDTVKCNLCGTNIKPYHLKKHRGSKECIRLQGLIERGVISRERPR